MDEVLPEQVKSGRKRREGLLLVVQVPRTVGIVTLFGFLSIREKFPYRYLVHRPGELSAVDPAHGLNMVKGNMVATNWHWKTGDWNCDHASPQEVSEQPAGGNPAIIENSKVLTSG